MSAEMEPVAAKALKQWLSKHGGGFHKDVMIVEDIWGVSVVAKENLPANAIVVSCPFSLIIRQSLARSALLNFIDVQDSDNWTERQWISTYICFHWIIDQNTGQSQKLIHYEYIHLLPSPDKLRTPHYFSESELEAFRGTNLYGATLDREREWRAEYAQCLAAVSRASAEWAALFTWERYLAGATYLASRAFPSSLLAQNPSLIRDPSTEPVLIPGLDLLNHARGAAVTWSVTYPVPNNPGRPSGTLPLISLVLHNPAEARQGIYNNYGPKPNSELILGYGFSIENNPEDTVILKVGGVDGRRWSVGRQGCGVEGLWEEILGWVGTEGEEESEDRVEAAEVLMEMTERFLDRIPQAEAKGLRAEVAIMYSHYIEGQRDVLEGIITFAKEKSRGDTADRSAGTYSRIKQHPSNTVQHPS